MLALGSAAGAEPITLVRGNATWRYQLGAEPAGWPYAVDGELRARGAIKPGATTALHAVTTFTLGKDQEGLQVLELRVRYRDAIAIWLDGVEIVRDGLPHDPLAAPARAHGPEWRTFYVPVAPGLLRLGDNALAIEVRPTEKRGKPELEATVVGRKDLGIVRGPIVTALGAHGATITVETDPGAEAAIDWGARELDHHATSPPGSRHEFVLADLPPRIHYRVTGGAASSKTFALHTAPSPGDTVRIGVYGDVRGGHDIHRQIIGAMLGEGLDLVCATGDMVLRGADEADWQKFFAITGELLAQLPYLATIGNHDVGWSGTQLALPPGPPDRPADAFWYATDLADIHLVFLDSTTSAREAQEKWLDADLAAARKAGARAILAFTHEGPYARGNHRGNALARDRYVPILAKHHVDLLFAGHDHLYQRGEAGGVRYIVTGGGGAGLYDASCGVPHKPPCEQDGMQKLAIEHHFLALTIDKRAIEMCPRRPDGSLLEPCVRYPLWHP